MNIDICSIKDFNEKEVIIFGASNYAKEIIPLLLKKKVTIKYIVDNDINKHNTKLLNFDVVSPEKLKSVDNTVCIVIASMYIEEISKQLREMKLEKQSFIYQEDNYKAWFDDERKISALIEKFNDLQYEFKSSKKAIIVVSPWFFSAVPWFSIIIGYLLAYDGKNVSIIYDDMYLGDDIVEYYIQNKSINNILYKCKEVFEIFKLSEVDIENEPCLDEEVNNKIRDFSEMNTIWKFRGESYGDAGKKYFDKIFNQYVEHYIKIYNFLYKNNNTEYVFIPGGIGYSSCLYKYAAKNIRVSTYDAGPSKRLLLCADGLACQLEDIPRSVELLNKKTYKYDKINKMVNNEMHMRINGNVYKFLEGKNDKLYLRQDSILLLLNVSWDGAVLGQHSIFKNNIEWILATVEWILSNTEYNVVIRQHPSEQLYKSIDDYKNIIDNKFNENKRIIFVAAESTISSYELIKEAQFVIVGTSTVGIESVIMNKVVITGCNSYYSKSGIVYSADSEEKYFNLIKQGVEKKLYVTNEMKELAKKYYFIAQICNWVDTDFTPAQLDFNTWVNKNVEYFLNDTVIKDIIKSIDSNVPISYLEALKFLQNDED